MSKTADERIEELERDLKGQRLLAEDHNRTKEELGTLKEQYGQAYQSWQEAQRNSAYYQGKLEAQADVQPKEDEYTDYSQNSYSDEPDVKAQLDKLIAERLEPRLQQVERYATDALQQTAGREIDRALRNFKDSHPESGRIMDFDRLVMLDAGEEIQRNKQMGIKTDDLKALAIKAAQNRLESFNKMESEREESNKKRRETAHSRAMLPDVFAAAGFEEAPKTPDSIKEAGDLLEDLIKRQANGAASRQ